MIAAIVDELAEPCARNSIGHIVAAQLSLRPATIQKDCARKPASRRCAVSSRSGVLGKELSGIASTEAEIAQPTARCISPSDAYGPTREPRTMSLVG